jgi:N-acetylmuramoyl-L-alanine amidase
MRILNYCTPAPLFLVLFCFAACAHAETTVFSGSKSETGNLRVMLDPAHGGADEGSHGVNSLKEKDVNLSLALFLAAKLDDAGFEPRLTRDSDKEMTPEERAAAVNRVQPAVFISIEVNGSELRDARGFELFVAVPPAESADPGFWRAGQAKIHEKSLRLADSLETYLRPLGLEFRGKAQIPSPLLGAVTSPAVLVTLGNISWSQGADLLTKDAGKQALAKAVVSAVKDYFTKPKETEKKNAN